QRIIACRGDTDRYVSSGWEVANRGAFLAALRTLRDAGVEPRLATSAELDLRKVQEMAWFFDPSGNRHELVWGFKSDFARFQSPCGFSRFVTGDLGMGHTVLPAP